MIEGQVSSCLDFGAVGDDSTDNTTAIQNWLNYCIANDLTAWVPDGIFKFGHVSVTVPSNQTLRIRGDGTLKLSNISVYNTYPQWIEIIPTGDRTEIIDIRDIVIDGNNTKWSVGNYVTDNPSGYNDAIPVTGNWLTWFMMSASGFHRVNFQNVTFNNWKRGISLDACRYVNMENCWSDSYYTIGQVLLAADDCEAFTFANNQCRGLDYSSGTANFGIGYTSASVVLPHNCTNVLIDGNNLYGHQVVVRVTTITSVTGRRCIMTDNVIDYPVADTAVYGYQDVSISNNTIRRSGDVGISVDESQYVSIVGNTIDGCCVAGITSFDPIALTIVGNTVKDVAQDYADSLVSPSESTAVGIWVSPTNPNYFLKEAIIANNALVLTSRPPLFDPVAIRVDVFGNPLYDTNQNFVIEGNSMSIDQSIGPKWVVGAAEGICYISSPTGTPIIGEVLVGASSGVYAQYQYHTSGQLWFSEPTGAFTNGETITGQTSGATFTALNTGGGTNPRWTGAIVRNNVDLRHSGAGNTITSTLKYAAKY